MKRLGIYYLLKHEKYQCGIVNSNASSTVASFWFIFGFLAELNKERGNFERS